MRAVVRKVGYWVAWNLPRLYLWLIVNLRLRRSAYFNLVQSCKEASVEDLQRLDHSDDPQPVDKKRILFVIYWYELGGAESFALHTMKLAKELGHSCFCVSTVPSTNSERDKFSLHSQEAITFECVEGKGSFEEYISEYIRNNAIDVVHIHHSALMYEALPAIRRAFPKLHVVDSTHIVEYRDGGFPQLSATYSDYIDLHNVISRNLMQVQSALYRREYDRDIPPAKFRCTYLSNMAPGLSVTPRDFNRARKVITFYGRLVLQKQPNVFIATVEQLMARYPQLDVEAQIFGDGELTRELQERIARSRFKARLKYLGRCDDPAVVFEDSDLLLLTSLNEGISLTSYEALSSGRLVVSSDVGAQSELLSNECLIPLKPGFTKQAATVLHDLLTNDALYHRLLSENLKGMEELKKEGCGKTAIGNLYAAERLN